MRTRIFPKILKLENEEEQTLKNIFSYTYMKNINKKTHTFELDLAANSDILMNGSISLSKDND